MGRIMRDIGRKIENPNGEIKDILDKSNIIFHQQRGDKSKIYRILKGILW